MTAEKWVEYFDSFGYVLLPPGTSAGCLPKPTSCWRLAQREDLRSEDPGYPFKTLEAVEKYWRFRARHTFSVPVFLEELHRYVLLASTESVDDLSQWLGLGRPGHRAPWEADNGVPHWHDWVAAKPLSVPGSIAEVILDIGGSNTLGKGDLPEGWLERIRQTYLDTGPPPYDIGVILRSRKTIESARRDRLSRLPLARSAVSSRRL
jgi:hypothetical protein